MLRQKKSYHVKFRVLRAAHFILLSVLLLCVGSCTKKAPPDPVGAEPLAFHFEADANGWLGDFADLPSQPLLDYGLEFSHAVLPSPLNMSDGALRQSGINRSDDLFMFIKRKVTGLVPGKEYLLDLEVEIASNVPDSQTGVGGSPGESVYIKAGAASIEPVKWVNNYGDYRLNIDKGNQATEGPTVKIMGNFANGTASSSYVLKRLRTPAPVRVAANERGELWLIVGTDSGFEGKTTIFYNTVKVTFL